MLPAKRGAANALSTISRAVLFEMVMVDAASGHHAAAPHYIHGHPPWVDWEIHWQRTAEFPDLSSSRGPALRPTVMRARSRQTPVMSKFRPRTAARSRPPYLLRFCRELGPGLSSK